MSETVPGFEWEDDELEDPGSTAIDPAVAVEVATIEVPYSRVNQLAIHGRHVAFGHPVEGAGDMALATQVSVVDWKTGRLTKLHDNSFEDGQSVSPKVRDGWVMFADEDRLPEGADLLSKWRLYVVPADGSDQARVLAESRPLEESWSPFPVAHQRGFTFNVQEVSGDATAGSQILSWELGDEEAEIVGRRLRHNSYARLSGGRWVTSEPTKHPGKAMLWGADVHLYANGGISQPLTEHGWVQAFDVDGDVIAWGERLLDEDDNPSPRTAAWSVWMADARADPLERHLLYEGWHRSVSASSAGFVTFRKGDSGRTVFAAWPGLDEPVPVASLEKLVVPGGYALADDLLVYATKRRGVVRIHVVRITVPE